MYKLLFGVLLLAGWWENAPSNALQDGKATGKLHIRFENLEVPAGSIRLALYSNKEEFMNEKKAVLYSFKVAQTGSMEAEIPDLPFGEYAFALFHDVNENKALDKNFLGVPSEPYAFSKSPASKWRLPAYEEVKFKVSQPEYLLTVRLERWKL